MNPTLTDILWYLLFIGMFFMMMRKGGCCGGHKKEHKQESYDDKVEHKQQH